MRLAAGLAMVALVATASPAIAELYKWTDQRGIVYYTNERLLIPVAFREKARDIGAPQARAPEPRAPEPRPAEPRPAGGGTEIPYTSGAPIVTSVRLNGVPMTLILDTGADRTIVSPDAMARAGFDGEQSRQVNIIGVAGSAAAREVTVPLLDLAGLRVGPIAVIVHDVGFQGVDGLLGRDVLDYFTLTIDTSAGRAVLTPK